MEQLVFQIYRLLYSFIYFLLKVIRLFLPQGKLERSLIFRFDTAIEKKAGFDSQRPTICIHASSGEIEYAYPLIKKIKENFPTKNILVTLSSPSVLVAVKNNPFVDAYGPAPLDTIWSVRSFLQQWKPQLVLYARTDVWPEFSSQVLGSNIPSYIFSCTFSENSTRAKGFSALITKFSFENLNHIFTVTAEDKENLKKIGIKTPIEILGDTRFDQIEIKKKSPPLLKNLFPINAEQEDTTQNEDSNPKEKKEV
jgi:3-deoxy-D-manno-octulosonic-acid transferase